MLGVGGNVSQGILKSLALSDLRLRVVGACIDARSAGLYLTETAYVSPPAADPRFIDWLFEVCAAERVDAVLSGVEPVLDAIGPEAKRLHDETGAFAVVSGPEALAMGADKLATVRWLAARGLNAPRSADAGDPAAVDELVADVGLPLIAKPRRGKGSAGVLEVADGDDLAYVARRGGYLVQETLGTDEDEYTVATFSDRDGRVRGVTALRRGLAAGTTAWAEAGEFPEVAAEAERIAAELRPLGPLNVQLRLHDGRPTAFELNVRFSGTAPIRARLGFNDVDAALRHFVLGDDVELAPIASGLALRYWNEIYAPPEAGAALAGEGRLDGGTPAGWIEDYGAR